MSSSRRHFAVKRSLSSKNEGPSPKRYTLFAPTRSSTGLRGQGKFLPNRHTHTHIKEDRKCLGF